LLSAPAQLWCSPYLGALAAPPAILLLGVLLVGTRSKSLLYLGCMLIYLDVSLFLLVLLSIGAATGIVGWVWHVLVEPAKEAAPAEKLIDAAVALSLTFLAGMLLKLRHAHPASATLKKIIRSRLKNRVPAVMPNGPGTSEADILAYRAYHDDQFAGNAVAAIEGWGISASYRRLKLMNGL